MRNQKSYTRGSTLRVNSLQNLLMAGLVKEHELKNLMKKGSQIAIGIKLHLTKMLPLR